MQANTRARHTPVRYSQKPDDDEAPPQPPNRAEGSSGTDHGAGDDSQPPLASPSVTINSSSSSSSGSSTKKARTGTFKDPICEFISSAVDAVRGQPTVAAMATAGAAAVVGLSLGVWLLRGRSRGGSRPGAGRGSSRAHVPVSSRAAGGTVGKKAKKAKVAAAETGKPGPWAKLKPTASCVPLADGSAVVVRRPIAADNSCLFNAVGHCMHHSTNRAPFLRQVVAREVSSDPQEYSAAFLGMTNSAYCAWITNPVNWGGGIELAILAAHYHREIAAWNIETGSIHIFGEEKGYPRQVMVIYNGVHYDALAVAAGPRAPQDEDLTEFNPRTKKGKMILAAAKQLVQLNNKGAKFLSASPPKQQQGAAASAAAPTAEAAPAGTAVAAESSAQPGPGNAESGSTSLRCMECGETVEDAIAAAKHAQAHGHVKFAEVAPQSSA